MLIVFQDTKKGLIKVQTQGLDDLWNLYNIVRPGDVVKARTTRRVVKRDGDKGERRPMTLELRADNVEFHEYSNRLRIKGQITEGPEDFVSVGQFHTINVEVGTKLSITKEKWFKHEIARLKKSLSSQTNKIIMVIALESGLATIGLISNYSLNVNATVRHNIPGKRYSKQDSARELQVFFEKVNSVAVENIKNHEIQLVVLVGPGFTKEQYQPILKDKLKTDKINADIRMKNASSGTNSAIYEVLKKGEISSIISDHKISMETEYMEEFVTRLGKDNGRATYGLNETSHAAEMGAIERLLVTDVRMRTITSDVQNTIENLFNLVEKGRGEINIISTESPAGDQLERYGGIVSLLRFKVE